ncbi:MAG: ribosome silencing factor [Planctomycetes bacterium]|nr:ribosome silencing factor [Planctomycetota bacterium]
MGSREIALECARIAEGKKAERVVVLDVESLILITHYFVICSGNNRRQCQAIADEIRSTLKDKGAPKLGIEGYAEGRWILMDYEDVVVHIFLDEVRKYYDLELLWGDGVKVDWKGG